MNQRKGLKVLKSNDNDDKGNNCNNNDSNKNNNVCADEKGVCVAVRASKEISKTALVWALTHVVQPGDSIKLLVVIPSHTLGKRIWDFSRFVRDCTNSTKSFSGNSSEQKSDIADSCSRMVVQLHDVYDTDKVKIRIKIVYGSPSGVVAAEAKRIQATWVILDKQLKYEKKHCIEELNCNIVVMRQQEPEVLRLSFACSSMRKELETSRSLSPAIDVPLMWAKDTFEEPNVIRGPVVTPASSPEEVSPLTRTEVGTTSISSPSDPEASPFFPSRARRSMKKARPFIPEEAKSLIESDSGTTSSENPSSYFTTSYYQPWIDIHTEGSDKSFDKSLMRTYRDLLENLSKLDREPDVGVLNYRLDLDLSRSVREAISLCDNAPLSSPPLCSICQHKAPVFGKPPRWFSYGELELATGGFSRENFLAEGGFGSVYRGVLPEGQVVAVKQHKLASSQGDIEFCSEVEVLSCAQHRNVVMLIGLCVDDGRRLLVYEFICNGSLDSHLYGQDQGPLEWPARKRIAVGAARGLRYLHEECRVGCIVHRDMRPNNILLTHDFEPLVGDFGLARWQPDGCKEVETRVIGTFGYLAPEYAQSGQITEKADVYSFGVVLVELVTGRKAVDINRPKGQQCLTEWARPLLEKLSVEELVDPGLSNDYSKQEVCDVLQCASLCIQRDPHSRPRMSQVLRILEGDNAVNPVLN